MGSPSGLSVGVAPERIFGKPPSAESCVGGASNMNPSSSPPSQNMNFAGIGCQLPSEPSHVARLVRFAVPLARPSKLRKVALVPDPSPLRYAARKPPSSPLPHIPAVEHATSLSPTSVLLATT